MALLAFKGPVNFPRRPFCLRPNFQAAKGQGCSVACASPMDHDTLCARTSGFGECKIPRKKDTLEGRQTESRNPHWNRPSLPCLGDAAAVVDGLSHSISPSPCLHDSISPPSRA